MKRKIFHKQVVLLAFCLMFASLLGGCNLIGIIGTPTRYEREVPAEYRLSDLQEEKILVLVEQPFWLDVKVNLRVYITEAIHEQLIKQVDISPDRLIGYDKLSKYRESSGLLCKKTGIISSLCNLFRIHLSS